MKPDDDVFLPTITNLNSPLNLDSDMGEDLQDTDLEFFDTVLPRDSPTSGRIFEDSFPTSSPNTRSIQPAVPSEAESRSSHQQDLSHSSGPKQQPHQVQSTQLSVSPGTSSLDSSSDSSRRHKRMTSSNSSQSAVCPTDLTMTDEKDGSIWRPDELMVGGDDPTFGLDHHSFPSLGGLSDPLSMEPDYEISNKTMESHFDFDSAASSPSPYDASVLSGANYNGTAKIDWSYQRTQRPGNKFGPSVSMLPRSPVHASNMFVRGSREASPLSAMVTSQESSPSALPNSHSPSSSSSGEFLSSRPPSGRSMNTPLPTTYDFSINGLPSALPPSGLTPSPILNTVSPPYSLTNPQTANLRPRLTVHPTPAKSRVETQIPIKMTLFPMPPGITKLHLPPHTISKPKLLAKPPAVRSPDTLEVHTMLVCTSAMRDPTKLQRAFAHAAGSIPQPEQQSTRRSSSGDLITEDENDESRPLNGGEVVICPGCITRERKRAARKKLKKVEEEESWLKDEHKRVIVFNTHELREWHSPSKDGSAEADAHGIPPFVPDGAMQVDAPMRIACYCRHQNEKLGFQVIFTIKDHENRLVAQAITNSIMITDDHKTHAAPTSSSSGHNPNIAENAQLPGDRTFTPVRGFNVSAGPSFGHAPFRLSQSTNDLQGLRHNFDPLFGQAPPNVLPPSQMVSQTTSGTMTPRNLSRQASPSGMSGPSTKKRKASGPGKVPTGLAMTKLETADGHPTPRFPMAAPANLASAANTLPYATHNHVPAVAQAERSYGATSIPPQCQTGPPTPNSGDLGYFTQAQRSQSMENLPLQQIFSAPSSAHPSRAPSPTSASRIHANANALQQSPAQMAQAVANSFYGVPVALNPHRPPTIHKLIPSEGPRAGGIEVTCLGSGFCQGLEVMFGDAQATTTTYWGDASLVCLLPPAAQAGCVPVTFKHQRVPQLHMQQFSAALVPKQQIQFKYLDDDEQQLLKLALNIVGHKMTGRMEDAGDVARRIVSSTPTTWVGGSTQGNGQHRQASALDASLLGSMNLETALLACLDVIDQDDSPFLPRFNLRRPTGHALMHFAASLGLGRFIAGLLARGANPDVRDKGGYSPMHYASLHNHPQIVRRLRLAGGDPTMRSLRGYTPGDLAASNEVLEATRSVEYHRRSHSTGLDLAKSRGSSTTSLRSLWEPPSPTSGPMLYPDNIDMDSDDVGSDDSDHLHSSDECESKPASPSEYWGRSRGNSRATLQSGLLPVIVEPTPGYLSPSAAMTAWRDQIGAQIQHFQQSVHFALPNLQIPALPPMPNLPDYQAYPMVRRISSLVPHRGSPRPPTSSDTANDGAREGDYGWWELLTGTPSSPPAYEEIYPGVSKGDLNTKKSSAVQAAAEASLDQKCSELFDAAGGESGPSSMTEPGQRRASTVSLGQQQEQLRLAHAKRVKKLRSDRNLFFVWIPLLVLVVVAMLKNHVPQVWHAAADGVTFLRSRYQERAVAG